MPSKTFLAHKKSFIVAVLALVATAAIVGSLEYWYLSTGFALEKNALEGQINSLQLQLHRAQSAEDTSDAFGSTAEETYKDWKTFTDTKVGYSVKYPKDWTVRTEYTNQNTENLPNRIALFYSPNETYYLSYGLKKASDDSLVISPRSGTPAGSFENADTTLSILNQKVTRRKLVYMNHTWFYGYYTESPGMYEFIGEFNTSNECDAEKEDCIKSSAAPYEKIARDIIASTALIKE